MPPAYAHLRLLLEAIADAADSDDVVWLGGVTLDLGTQPADVDVDRAAVPRELVAPDLLQQDLTRQHLSWVCHQQIQYVEFLHRQGDLTRALPQPAARTIQHEVAERDLMLP